MDSMEIGSGWPSGFIHPKSQKFLKFKSKPPKVFQNIHDLLKKLGN